MEGKNKYYRYSKISQDKFELILKAFSDDQTAMQTAALTNISVRSINPVYLRLRERIAQYNRQTWQAKIAGHEKQVTISRTAIERPCEVYGRKFLVLVLNEFEQFLYLQIVEDARKSRPQKNKPHRPDQVLTGKSTDLGSNKFWSYLVGRLSKFRGVSTHTFYLHAKETEFRYNYGENTFDKLIEILETNPL